MVFSSIEISKPWLGVFGNPVIHSLSPLIHAGWFQEHAISASYLPIWLPSHIQPSTIRELLEHPCFLGCNVTVPFKSLFSEVCDECSTEASFLGVVNTVKKEKGRLLGFNTDPDGFQFCLKNNVPQWDQIKKVVVLGAGGSSRSVIYSLIHLGVDQISIWNRSQDRLDRLIQDFDSYKDKLDIQKLNEKHLNTLLNQGEVDLLVHCTLLGRRGVVPEFLQRIDWKLFRHIPKVDLNYPMAQTLWAQFDGESVEPSCIPGMDMLLGQAAKSFQIWFDVQPSISLGKESIQSWMEKKS